MPTPPTTREAILALLERNGPMSAGEIAAELGFSRPSVDASIRSARRVPGLLHISDWKRSTGTRGRMGAIYKLGPGRDAKQPEPFTKAETNAAWYRKHKAVIRLKARATYGTAPAGALGYMAVALGARA